MELLKLLSTSEIVAQVVNFLLLFFLLRGLFWKRVLALLDDRQAKIFREQEEIRLAKEESERLKADYQLKLRAIDQIAQEKLREVLALAERKSRETGEAARREAQKIVEDAKKEIAWEVRRSREALKEDIVGLVLRAAERVIGERATEKDDRRLVAEFLESVENMEGIREG
jgi:F-type H+-transporting ATPase subunit b